ncbi:MULTISPECIES: hypothetical protein [Shouchella]|uniref:DUF2273 domain-containing protein n=1 Tax=Shouchella lehensis G1 TaxID=1246626 RepID=A0A060LQH1_9BACI|nr:MULTISPECIES: hypothetical protein [Bacillaceae]AIC93526.1 hypothetical protein BleG1_0918 [Shouchella lehensis G1]
MNGSLIIGMLVGIVLGFIAAGSLGALIGLCAGILFHIANGLDSLNQFIKEKEKRSE